MQPITSCDQRIVQPYKLPIFNHRNPDQNAGAEVLMVTIIECGASEYDPPAMPPDVHDTAQLFSSRPHYGH
jgi:hypothetical protein